MYAPECKYHKKQKNNVTIRTFSANRWYKCPSAGVFRSFVANIGPCEYSAGAATRETATSGIRRVCGFRAENNMYRAVWRRISTFFLFFFTIGFCFVSMTAYSAEKSVKTKKTIRAIEARRDRGEIIEKNRFLVWVRCQYNYGGIENRNYELTLMRHYIALEILHAVRGNILSDAIIPRSFRSRIRARYDRRYLSAKINVVRKTVPVQRYEI